MRRTASKAGRTGSIPDSRFEMLSYAICTTPRTGSTYLCTMLRKARLGNPDEWLHPTRPRPWDSLEELRRVRARNDIFAIKLFWTHREDPAIVDFDDLEIGAWIYLRRRDLNAQACSYLTAVARDEWAGVQVPYLDLTPADVSHWEARFHRRNEDWQAWFRRKKIRPYRVVYEDFVADPHGTVAAIRDYLMAPWPSG